ncbi:hypothetical protein [Sphingobacterium kyonggiense]
MESGINNLKSGNHIKQWKFLPLYYIFVFYMFVLAPTSSGGALPDLNQIIISWLILLVTIFIGVIWFSNINVSQLVLVLNLLGLLMIFTIISNNSDPNARFSIARVAPILSFLILSFVTIKGRVSFKMVKSMIHIFMGIFLIWNFLIIIDSPLIKEFTISNYTQLYEEATSNMFIKKRPIMSFGIYTFASFFYFLFFLICRKLFVATNKKIFLYYQIFLLIANILLVSNTAFVFSFLMAFFVYKGLKTNFLKFLLVLILTGFVFYVFSNLELSNYYLESFNSDKNGFKGRYTESGTLETNLEYLNNFFFIGFNIVDGLTYSDSGYLVYYTMGSLILVLGMYISLYLMFKKNIPKDFYLILIPTLIFELALPVITYYKFMYAIIFFIISYRSIEEINPKTS